MQPRTKAVTTAVTGTAVGVAGLVWLAMPASAGQPPQLPPISAQDLVQSVLSTKTPALDGTVAVDNNLGLPMSTLPGGTPLSIDGAHVYNDGNGDSKLTVQQGAADTTFIRNGNTVWTYSSKDNTAKKTTVPADKNHQPASQEPSDPAAAATQLLAKVRESSTVSVEGTASVANRPAYELVLTPKPTEHTVLREVRVAVDAEKRVPLRLAVMTYGSPDPALQIAFSDIEFAAQPASEFQFTPPQGAKVTEEQAQLPDKPKAGNDVKVVGDGWDTVVTGTLPATALQPNKAGQAPGFGPAGNGSGFGPGHGNRAMDPKKLLAQYGKQVSGAFGTGYVVTTKVGSALITDDGRFAAGAVPEQMLIDALGAK